MQNGKNAVIGTDRQGNKIVVISEIIFHGKRAINWDDVEKYLLRYVGQMVEVAKTKDIIYIGREFPDEYKGSTYTRNIKGAYLKAKANASQGIMELIEIATNKEWRENKKEKHMRKVKNGWYYYRTRFAIPVYSNEKALEMYNVYSARLVIIHARKKLYLYDMVDLKKEKSIMVDELVTGK